MALFSSQGHLENEIIDSIQKVKALSLKKKKTCLMPAAINFAKSRSAVQIYSVSSKAVIAKAAKIKMKNKIRSTKLISPKSRLGSFVK